MHTLLRDLRFALRQLLKNPGFMLVAVFSLALGIGANTALFSVVYGVIISPYPYARPGEMWWPTIKGLTSNDTRMSYRIDEYLELAKLPIFSETMGTSQDQVLLTGDYAPETINGVRLTAGAFSFMGVPPVLGRTFGSGDIRPSGEPEPVTVISYQLWQRLFGGDPAVLGKTLRLNDETYTIVGVMPPRFGWYTSDGVWLPLGMDSRDTRHLNPLVRLKPGVSKAAAQEQFHALLTRLAAENPPNFPHDGFKSELINYLDLTVASGEMKTTLQLLFGAVGFLLLIACANVANLQLARATARAREMAIRISIGAARSRILRQLLTESVLLALIGGLLGIVFAVGITRLMAALMPSFYVPNEARIEINGWVLLFSTAVSMLTGIVFGLAPAIQSSRPDLTDVLKDAAKGTGTSAHGGRIREALVVAEVALAVILLVGAGLTLRSFIAQQRVALGFDPSRVLRVSMMLASKRYATLEQRARFMHELLERVKNLPGVVSATAGNFLSPLGGPESPYSVNGGPMIESSRILLHLGDPDYLKTLRVPLVRGRMLEQKEIDAAEPVAVINEAAVAIWPAGENPIGKQLRIQVLGHPWNPNVLTNAGARDLVTVVGIIGNTKNDGLRESTKPEVILPYTLLAPPFREVAVRSQSDPYLLVHAIKDQIRQMDSQQPVGRATTLEEELGFQTLQPRFTMALFALVAAIGLTLAICGVYSILSYLVTRRTREIGVRMALGAQRSDVLRLILTGGGRLVLGGLALGVVASLGLARLLQSQLFQISASDPISFGGVALLLGAAGLAACYIPARRAMRVEPMEALRQE